MIVKKLKNNRDNQYINLVITPDPQVEPADTVAKFNNTLATPINIIPDNYYCSVLRFSVPMSTIPMLKFPCDETQNNPNVSFLTIGIKTAVNTYFPVNVIYVPANNLAPPVAAAVSPFFNNFQLTSQYYDVFSIFEFLDMFNTALATAVVNAALGVAAPFYTYDPTTELISLNTNAAFEGTGAEIFVNRYLLNYLHSFAFYFEQPGPSGIAGGIFLHQLTARSRSSAAFVYQEDYSSIQEWYDLRRISIETSLPISYESIPVQDPNLGGRHTGQNSFEPVLCDHIVTFNELNPKSIVIYNPKGQYRLVDMTSTASITKMDLQFFYHDKFGNKYPLLISVGEEISIKLGFFRKELYLKEEEK